MKLITWNLNGLEDRYLDERTEAAMFQILLGVPLEKAMVEGFKPNTPDIIVLQEVVSRSFHAHITPHLKAAGFDLYPIEPTERSYFEVIATRLPIMESRYDSFDYSDQGRGLTTLTLGDKKDTLTVMTAHLESMKPGSSMRVDQASTILKQMNKLETPCIFAGDTNLRKSEWQGLAPDIVMDVSDAWEASGSPKAHKSTWVRAPYKARYDRIWTHRIKVNNLELFGANKIPTIKETPSDHRAIRIGFEKT